LGVFQAGAPPMRAPIYRDAYRRMIWAARLD
jgi:hypothetical protein